MAKKIFRSLIASAGLLLLMLAPPAGAIDIYPGDYILPPSGTNLALLYLGYQPSNNFRLDGGGKVPHSSLDQSIGIARFLHYSDIAGLPVAYQAYVPFANLSDAKVGGVKQPVSNGIGYLELGFTIFPIHTKGEYSTTLGITAYVSVNTGNYTYGNVNAAYGSTVWTPQIGLVQGLGHGFFFDGAADVAVQARQYHNNVPVSVGDAVELQGYLRYQLSPASSVSFGYAGSTGGKQYVDNVYQEQEAQWNQLRIFASHTFSSMWQVSGMLSKATSTTGGFKQDYYAQIRIMKIF